MLELLHGLKRGIRASVFRGRQALYENGERSTDAVPDLSYRLPILIDILLPERDAETVLRLLRPLVTDGVLTAAPLPVIATGSLTGLLPSHLLVRDVMSAPPVVAHPDFPVRAAVELMVDRGLKALPVVDQGAHPVGILTTTDLLRASLPVRLGLFATLPPADQEAYWHRCAAQLVASVMTRSPDTIEASARAGAPRGPAHRSPGIPSPRPARPSRPMEVVVHGARLAPRVETLMERSPPFVEAHAGLDKVLALMVESGRKRLPVVEDGRFLGMVRRDAVLAALAEHSEPAEDA